MNEDSTFRCYVPNLNVLLMSKLNLIQNQPLRAFPYYWAACGTSQL